MLQLAGVLLRLLLWVMMLVMVALGCLGARHLRCHWQSIAIHDPVAATITRNLSSRTTLLCSPNKFQSHASTHSHPLPTHIIHSSAPSG